MEDKIKLHMAPLQGYADQVYRKYHHQMFGGIDCYYSPFIRVEKGVPRKQDIVRLDTSRHDGYNLVPQAIFRSVDELVLIVDAATTLGYDRIDLNLGCPHPMQTGKGRGAALVSNADIMKDITAYIRTKPEIKFSVKMRLGVKDPKEWKQIIDIVNAMPLEHVTVHPRIAKQMYKGELYMDQFDDIYQLCKHPLIYNGDISSPEDIDRIVGRYPTLKAVMIGRGLLARPTLAAEWKSGTQYDHDTLLEKIIDFHDKIFEVYRETLCGDVQILQKIKPFWEYMKPLIGHKVYKAIHKASNINKYITAVGNL